MKRIFIVTGLLFVFLTVYGCSEQSSNQGEADDLTSQADWPLLSLEELTNQADLIAFASVTGTEAKEKGNGLQAQISTLTITDSIAGPPEEEIQLDQVTDYVEEGGNYLLFLDQKGEEGYYYILSPSGVIEEQDGLYISNRLGGGGAFTEEEIKRLIVNSLN